MAKIPTTFKELCAPSQFYFAVSIISMVLIMFQNMSNNHRYNVGTFSCAVPNTALIFITKLLYVLFWTWILNLICKDGHKTLAWVLVFLPFILFFVLIGLVMIMG